MDRDMVMVVEYAEEQVHTLSVCHAPSELVVCLRIKTSQGIAAKKMEQDEKVNTKAAL